MAVTLAPELNRSVVDLIAASSAYGGDSGLDVRIESRQRTLRNDVLRCRVLSSGGPSRVYVKIERSTGGPNTLEREYRTLTSFRSAFASLRPRFDCVEPLAFQSGPPGMLLLAECRGTSLHRVFRRSWGSLVPYSELDAAAVCATGQWVRHLEERSIGSDGGEAVALRLQEAADRAERRIRGAGNADRISSLVRRCRDLIDTLVASTPASPVYSAHGDLHPQNIFVSAPEHRVCVIDFQQSSPRFVGYDALYFELSVLLGYGRLRIGRARLRRLLSPFWTGYGRKPEVDPLVYSGLRAHLVLRMLAYLSSNARRAGCLRRLAFRADLQTIHEWFDAEPPLTVEISPECLCAN